MAVVGVAKEHPDSPISAREGPNGVTITRRFIVLTDSRLDGPVIVLGAVGVPQRGNFYVFGNESNPYLFCKERSPQRVKGSQVWWVDCEYSPLEKGESPEQQQRQGREPIFDLPQITMPTVKRQVDMKKDRDDNPVVNGAGDPFMPHPKKDVSTDQLTIVRNEPLDSPIIQIKDTYVDTLNASTFWGRPAERWKCEAITPENQLKIIEGIPYPYLRVTYVFNSLLEDEFEYLNQGYRFLTGATYPGGHPRAGQKVKRAFNTVDGWNDVDFLTSAGLPSATPNFLTFPPYATSDYDALQLPSSFVDISRV